MKSNQEYYTSKIEEIATNKNYQMYETLKYSNIGIWLFRNKNNVKKLYFNFQNNCGKINIGNGNIYKGVLFEFGNIEEENKMYDFIEKFLD